MSMMAPRILLADDHWQILANLSRLAGEAGEVVGTAQDGRAAVTEARRLCPDVIVLDLSMPDMTGIEAAAQLRRDLPESKVIICTVYTNPRVVEEAFAAGAAGFVLKQAAAADLAAAIRAVVSGERFLSPGLRYRERAAEASGSVPET